MYMPENVSSLPLLSLAIIFTSVSLGAMMILSTVIWHANYAFALEQNSPLSQQQQKNDNINHESNITKKFTLIADEKVVKISPNNFFHPNGILYKAMTFNYTIPGPVIAVNQGDTFQITLKNKGEIIHSLDLHGIEGPNQALSGVVQPGESKTWRLKAINAGVFMYHCDGDNLNGIWDHIASGMYGGIVVHSKDERKAAKEFYIVFGEVYNNADKELFNDTIHANATATTTTTSSSSPLIDNAKANYTALIQKKEEQKIGSFDMAKFIANKPDLILTNGMAYKYMPFFGSQNRMILNENAELFRVKPGELTRWYIVNAGPRGNVAFNFVSGMINSISYDANKSNAIGGKNNDKSNNNNSTSAIPLSTKLYEISIPPGSAQTIEVTFPQEGTYVGNDHDIGRFLIGAGFAVLATNSSASSDYPTGTRVPS